MLMWVDFQQYDNVPLKLYNNSDTNVDICSHSTDVSQLWFVSLDNRWFVCFLCVILILLNLKLKKIHYRSLNEHPSLKFHILSFRWKAVLLAIKSIPQILSVMVSIFLIWNIISKLFQNLEQFLESFSISSCEMSVRCVGT